MTGFGSDPPPFFSDAPSSTTLTSATPASASDDIFGSSSVSLAGVPMPPADDASAELPSVGLPGVDIGVTGLPLPDASAGDGDGSLSIPSYGDITIPPTTDVDLSSPDRQDAPPAYDFAQGMPTTSIASEEASSSSTALPSTSISVFAPPPVQLEDDAVCGRVYCAARCILLCVLAVG